jgi:hypothetical protein
MGIVKDTDLSPKQAGYFVGVSVSAYCPQYKGKTDNSMTWMAPIPPDDVSGKASTPRTMDVSVTANVRPRHP